MEKTISGKTVSVNEEGYLTDFSQWNRDIAGEIAREEQIVLSERHWEVIAYLQEQYKKKIPMSIRKIRNSGVIDIKEFYALFPKGPLKTASRIAGLPKPVSCI
ncbi:MAG TPA: TusE/DsrC/DsvC family sulfur relay protein [Bacteroidia bacterium]|nr:TusE/DsrC/DsvC family sulfur relay protein [Bacteroidia bacterium]